MMKARLLLPVLLATIASAGLASAQYKGGNEQPPAKQSAPADSTDASGHDAQTGRPETAEKVAPKITLTEEQAKSWIAKPVFSSDGKELGEVAAFKRSANNTVLEMHVLGTGETHVGVTPVQFKLENDRVVLTLTADQAKALPKVKKTLRKY